MSEKILVTYASVQGSTAEVAQAIARTLQQQQRAEVDVLPVAAVRDVAPYDAVVVGSAVRGGRWLPEAVHFVAQHRAALQGRPVAYFLVCLTLREDTPANRSRALDFLEPVLAAVPEVAPVAVGMFAGRFDPRQLSFVQRLSLRLRGAGVPGGDFRDWGTIREWAAGLPWHDAPEASFGLAAPAPTP